jgi:hypothetical protein
MECHNALSTRSEGNNSVTNPCPQQGVEIKSRACQLLAASRLKIREARVILFREQL